MRNRLSAGQPPFRQTSEITPEQRSQDGWRAMEAWCASQVPDLDPFLAFQALNRLVLIHGRGNVRAPMVREYVERSQQKEAV